MSGTFWALVPAIFAIVLALLTKEVYISLFAGILAGALFFTGFQIIPSLETILKIIADKASGNMNIIIFLIILGMIVALVQKSGASKAYGDWAGKKIKSRRGALGITSLLGIVIFVDDYFNCLTVGTVMSPITDKFKVSRARLAYIIDATAAPVCIIAPISSWAAAVSSSLPEGSTIDGFSLFLQTIPFNLYAILTLIMVFLIIAFDESFSKMRKIEQAHPDPSKLSDDGARVVMRKDAHGKVVDLILPVIVLIFLCISFMLYTGGILEGKGFIEAFGDCDASVSLVLGGFFTLLFTALMYLPRKILTFAEFNTCLSEGFKSMVPAILILTFAWALSGISGEGYLEAGAYVSNLIETHQFALGLVPFIFYLVALGLAFSTGTSWGTFGILIPIAATIFMGVDSTLLVISVAAILAGAVNGDHISPISDTTILSSAGAGCDHIMHVSTQIPYTLVVTIPALIGFLIMGLTENGWLGLAVSVPLLLLALVLIKKKVGPLQDMV